MSVFFVLFSLFFLSSFFLNFFSSFHSGCSLFCCCRWVDNSLSCLSCFFSNHLSKSILCVFWRFLIHKTSRTWISLLFIKFERFWLSRSLLWLLLFQIILKVLLKLVKIRHVSSLNRFKIVSLLWLLGLQFRLLFLNLLMHFHSWGQLCFLVAQLSVSTYSFFSFKFVSCHHLFKHFYCYTGWWFLCLESGF